MATLYKLTTQDHRTRPGEYNECAWGEGVSHSGTDEGGLCGPGYIHAYTHPLLAVLFNPIHAGLVRPALWVGEGDVAVNDNGIKVGCVTFTTLRTMPLPEVTPTQRVAFGILCTREVCADPQWKAWADAWLSGEDRSTESAEAAHSAADAAYAAAYAADAAYAAAAAAAYAAAYAAADATYAAAAAYAAAAPSYASADGRSRGRLDLIALAEQAMEYTTGAQS